MTLERTPGGSWSFSFFQEAEWTDGDLAGDHTAACPTCPTTASPSEKPSLQSLASTNGLWSLCPTSSPNENLSPPRAWPQVACDPSALQRHLQVRTYPSRAWPLVACHHSAIQQHVQVRNHPIRTWPPVACDPCTQQQHLQVRTHSSRAWPPVTCERSALQQHLQGRNHPCIALPSEACEKLSLSKRWKEPQTC